MSISHLHSRSENKGCQIKQGCRYYRFNMFYWTCQSVWRAVCLFAMKKSASKNKSWDSVCTGLIYSGEGMNRNSTFWESITNSIVFYKGKNFCKPSVVNQKETWKLWGEFFTLLCSVANRTGGVHNCKLS